MIQKILNIYDIKYSYKTEKHIIFIEWVNYAIFNRINHFLGLYSLGPNMFYGRTH